MVEGEQNCVFAFGHLVQMLNLWQKSHTQLTMKGQVLLRSHDKSTSGG
jgi:hypothetical protein